MNHLFRFILWGGVAVAAAFTGCTKDIEEPIHDGTNTEGTPIRLCVEMAETTDSRATIDVDGATFTGAWEQGDAIGLCTTFDGGAMAKPIALTYDGTYFTGTLPAAGTKGEWKYNAFSPMGATGFNKYATIAYVAFGAVRTQQGNKFNSAFDPLAADQKTCAASDPGRDGDEVMKLTLHRLTSILHFDFSTADAAVKDEKVKSIILTADKDIAAEKIQFKFNQAGAFDLSAAALKFSTGNIPQSKSITLEYEAATAPTAAAFEGFINLLPGDYTTFTVQVFTENHKTSFTFDRTGKPLVAGKLYNKAMAITQWETLSDPTAVWVDNDIDATHEILPTMDVRINILADRGIKDMTVDIESQSLVSSDLLAMVGLDSHMNLVTPATPEMAGALQSLGFPVGDQLLNKSAAPMNISDLIPMLLAVSQIPSENHTFVLTITDNTNVVSTHSLKFHTTIPGKVSYNKDADLWENTATLTAAVTAEQFATTHVLYKRSDATTWNEATLGTQDAKGVFTATIAPTWETTKNAAGQDVLTPNPETGVFAGATYDFKLVIAGADVKDAAGQFTAAAGDQLPNADMSEWSTVSRAGLAGSKDVAYPNKVGDSFWDCGNNGITTTLCTSSTDKVGTASPAAKLQSQNALVLASGNLFTGSFNYASMTGTVKFGSKYTYTARPTALRVKYHAKTGAVDILRSKNPAPGISKGDPDKARIFVAIVDWSQPHTVVSGTSSTTGAWDPTNGADAAAAEGKIIGYGSMWITQTTEGDALVSSGDELKIHWYDQNAVAPTGNYTLVISCAANAYGDYMTGYSGACLYVDDFEWVY